MSAASPPVRLARWEPRLRLYLEEQRHAPFAWGRNDCALFVAGAVAAMTGVDLAAAFRGGYSDARGAAAALKAHGAGTLRATVTALLGPALHPARAMRGDVVECRKALGVCTGGWFWMVGENEHGQPGLLRLPMTLAERIWHVPFPCSSGAG